MQSFNGCHTCILKVGKIYGEDNASQAALAQETKLLRNWLNLAKLSSH